MIPLLFFATCGEPEISDDWTDDFEVVEQTEEEGTNSQVNGSYFGYGESHAYFGYGVSHGGDQLSFKVPEGWQAETGSGNLVVTVTHLSSGTRVDFYNYDLGVELPVPRSDCEWGYSDPVAVSPFRGVESVVLTSCLLRESGDRIQAVGFEQSGGRIWQVESRLKVGYLAVGLEVSEELFSELEF
jgi:hypothetical protein